MRCSESCYCRRRQQASGPSSGMPRSASTTSSLTQVQTCGATASHCGRQRLMARNHTRYLYIYLTLTAMSGQSSSVVANWMSSTPN